ncbi:MAG: shikimate kinase [Muribaculaceae bacterium]|nr:shikimate kinase [Muribaculaceae bacterium]
MKPIFIIGYMGCGKTTFGRALAQASGLRFIDLDDFIEERYGASVREIFDSVGEEGFRLREKEMLRLAGEFSDCIVSCGGGTPCFFDNMDYMNSVGTTLWLMASEETLMSRLVMKREKRPLLAKKTDDEIKSFIATQLEARSPFYGKAKLKWKGDSLEDKRQIDSNIAEFLSSHSLQNLP